MDHPRQHVIGQIPDEKQLEIFFKGSELTRYFLTLNGAYMFKGPFNGDDCTLIVKPTRCVKQELFANILLDLIGIKTPNITSILLDSTAGKAAKAAIIKFDPMLIGDFMKNNANQLLILNLVRGKNLSDVNEDDLNESLKNNPDSIQHILEDIGSITIADLLMFYMDRLPLFGEGNLSNLRLLIDDRRYYLGVVAIDQAAWYKGSKSPYLPEKETLFQELAEIIKKMLDDKHSKTLEYLFEDISEPIYNAIDLDVGLAALQKGLKKTIANISKLDPAILDDIYKSLPDSNTIKDKVVVELYKESLLNIKNAAAPFAF